MDCTIPSGIVNELLDCWNEMTDQTYDIFGSECLLLYSRESNGVPVQSSDDIPTINTINPGRRSGPPNYRVQDQKITSEKNSEIIRVKIYWNPREWYKVYGYSTAPEDQVMVLCKLEDSIKINNAVAMQFTDKFGSTYHLTKKTKVIPYGFQKTNFGSSLWTYEK